MRRGRLMAAMTTLFLTAALAASPGCRARAVERAATRTSVPVADRASAKAHSLSDAAAWQVGKTVRYDAAYAELRYPGGDVPLDRGACTDVVVRAFRRLGVDLQVAVHEDMERAFKSYPQRWGLPGPDANIDHRRVPNLQTYFSRRGVALRVTHEPADYQPGDVVAWDVFGRPHIGIVSARRSADGSRFCVTHNIGSGVQVTDDLFTFRITGHYRPF